MVPLSLETIFNTIATVNMGQVTKIDIQSKAATTNEMFFANQRCLLPVVADNRTKSKFSTTSAVIDREIRCYSKRVSVISNIKIELAGTIMVPFPSFTSTEP